MRSVRHLSSHTSSDTRSIAFRHPSFYTRPRLASPVPRRRNKPHEREIARERIERLLELAEVAALDGRLDDAARYGQLAWRLTTRHRLPVEDELKQRVCRGCKRYLLPGRTARTRIEGGKVSTTCERCGRVRRIPLGSRAVG